MCTEEALLSEPVSRLGVGDANMSDLGGSYLSPSNKAAVLSLQFSKLEGPGFRYHRLFSDATLHQVHLTASHHRQHYCLDT